MSEFKSLPNAADMARELAERCRTWTPATCLLGNIRADDLADLAEWVAALPGEYFLSGALDELVDRHPNGLTEKMFETAAWFHHCTHLWVPEARLIERADEDGMTDIRDPGMLVGDLRHLASFILRIPRADNEQEMGPGPAGTAGPG
jgi:hypothetical protein